MPSTEAIIGLGQLIVALLVWFGVDARTLGRRLTMSAAPRNKLLLILILGGLAFATYAVYASGHRYNRAEPVEILTGITYTHQEVELDGRRFENCVFDGVTLMYRGKAEVRISGCKFIGTNILTTDNPAITTYERLVGFMGSQPGMTIDPRIINRDEKGRYYQEFRQRQSEPSPKR